MRVGGAERFVCLAVDGLLAIKKTKALAHQDQTRED
jgi:hypothetical protein